MSLASCVESLNLSCTLLDRSLQDFQLSLTDFPRLTRLLTNERHFELVAESQVTEAQRALVAEIGPQKEALLARAHKLIMAEERREAGLKSRVALNAVRLKPATTTSGTSTSASTGDRSRFANGQMGRMQTESELADAADRAERMRVLRAKKARLAYQLKTIHLENVGRKTRMSLAPRGMP